MSTMAKRVASQHMYALFKIAVRADVFSVGRSQEADYTAPRHGAVRVGLEATATDWSLPWRRCMWHQLPRRLALKL